ncbi:hypothetical protein D3C72_1857260 [compost metagenome]
MSVGEFGDGLGAQHVVDEGVGGLGVRRVGWDDHGVEPDQGAFAGNAVDHLEGHLGLARLVGGDGGVAVVGQGQADLALGQVIDVLAGADVADVRLQLGEELVHGRKVGLGGAVGVLAEVVQGDADHLLRRVDHGDAAVL